MILRKFLPTQIIAIIEVMLRKDARSSFLESHKQTEIGAPIFSPQDWDETDEVQFNTNCYSYACDIKAGYAQPGLASGNQYQRLTCAEVVRAAIADGLVPATPDEDTLAERDCHLVALAIAPNSSFHWYRRDTDGTWSHKLGDTPPTKLDDSGRPIYDPRTADRGPHMSFCGFFWVSKRRVTLK